MAFGLRRRSKNIDFQDGYHDTKLRFPIGTILATFDLQVILMLPSKFGVNWPSVQEKKLKIDFQDGGHFKCPIGTIFAIFDL